MWKRVVFFLHWGQPLLVCQLNVAYLFELVDDHGECFKDGSGWSCQGDDPLGAIAFGDVDASSTLQRNGNKQKVRKFLLTLKLMMKVFDDQYKNNPPLLSSFLQIHLSVGRKEL